MFSVCYLFMSISNIFKIFNDPFETLQFNLGAYFIQDFFSIGYLTWIHQLNFGGMNKAESSYATSTCNRSDELSVKLSDFYLREMLCLHYEVGTNDDTEN